MAANSRSVQGIASFGKQLVSKIRSRHTARLASAFIVRRSAHTSVYDKNVDDQVRPSAVPDEVIQLQSDKYWAPHPQTGVFGPAAEHNPGTASEHGSLHTSPSGDSILEEKAWFRPTSLEDLEKSDHN